VNKEIGTRKKANKDDPCDDLKKQAQEIDKQVE